MLYIENYALDVVSNSDTKFEVELSNQFKRVKGFTFSVALTADYDKLIQTSFGSGGLFFDSNQVTNEDTPLRLFISEDVCFDCKFVPYEFENPNKTKVKGSLKYSSASTPFTIYLIVWYEENISGSTLETVPKC